MSEDLIDVLVETPQGSRKKYEYDHERGAMRLDRRLFSATVYPADYGFVPDTASEDGEALDALVLAEEPSFPGCWVHCRPIGVFWIGYESGREAKIIAVPDGDPRWEGIRDVGDLPTHTRDEISHFFDVYKDLEPGSSPSPGTYEGVDVARRVISEARRRRSDGDSGQ